MFEHGDFAVPQPHISSRQQAAPCRNPWQLGKYHIGNHPPIHTTFKKYVDKLPVTSQTCTAWDLQVVEWVLQFPKRGSGMVINITAPQWHKCCLWQTEALN